MSVVGLGEEGGNYMGEGQPSLWPNILNGRPFNMSVKGISA